MARGDKKVELKTVAETEHEEEEIVRLAPEDVVTESPVRLRLQPEASEPEPEQRLPVVARENFESRSFQPGIEVLIETPEVPLAPLEQDWGRDPATREATPWGWFVLIALALGGAVIWSVTRVNKAKDQARQIRVETKSVLGQDALEEKEAARLVELIRKTTHEFFQSTNLEAMAAMVRHPDRVRPLMEGYYNSGHEISPDRVLRTTVLQPLTLNNRANFWMESVELEKQGKKNLVVEIVASGKVKIDWETLVCYQPMPWDSFATQRPEGTSLDFRVYVEADTFFSHEFADPKQWDCYRITALDSDETLFGYCRKTDESAPLIREMIHSNQSHKASMILRLGIPIGLQSRRGVVIEKLLSARWLYLESPGDGS